MRTAAPRATWTIIAANVAVYLVMVVRGDNGITADAARLVAAGGNFGPLVASGEWWRIVTAAFLHGGLLHISLNMVALWSGGILLEHTVGTPRFLAIYFASAVGAGLSSLLVSPSVVSVGASGAIFGVYGSLLGLALQHTRHRTRADAAAIMPPHIARRLVSEIVGLFVFNLLIGLIVPGIDTAAHVGGFLCGIALAWLGSGAAWLAWASALVLAASVAFAWVPLAVRLSALDAACGVRIGAACVAAGRILERAPGRKDAAATLAYFDRGCSAGSAAACLAAGQAHLGAGNTGGGAAAQAFGRACDRGEPRGCSALALLYETGRGVARDDKRAARLFGRACEGKNGFACLSLAALHRAGRGVPVDTRRAAQLEITACDLGEVRACTLAAAALVDGSGVKKDVTRGMALYQKACDAHDPIACERLAGMVEDGSMAPKDVSRAAVLLEKACSLGRPAACARAGEIIDKEIDAPKRAALAYERGCALGDARSCYEIATMCLNGRGRPKSVDQAITYYEQACRRGMKQVCGLVTQLR